MPLLTADHILMDVRAALDAWLATPDRAWFGFLTGALAISLEFVRPSFGLPGLAGGVALIVCAVRLGAIPAGLLALAFVTLLLTRLNRWWLVATAVAIAGATEAADVSGAGLLAACGLALGIFALLQIAERARRNKLDR